ncbi:small multi-drug export protein [Aureisphaera sp. CAU 1614]|uniref:Small multi-drug export protein n=2 Tax=Halomarinibacterium sedimenti TaxID=2857106 RepID=A0A9X1FNE3_9FLAO|nr:small multi-drug export protein [Halomarinibacterium sedimenti]MBW2937418.1 small multi-drug export protein [Halomarinibacterium sedimenti]
MIQELITVMLWSISPFGEAKVGIPVGLLNGTNIYLVFIVAFAANVLVFPMMMFFLDKVNHYLLAWNFYKKSAIWVARRAKTGSGNKIQKYGFWGLLLFVMIPLPGTGVYAGSIATYLFKIEKSKAFYANTIGIFLSSLIVWGTTVLTMKGIY